MKYLKAFKLWVALSNEEKEKTALMQKIVPGSHLFLPPGMMVEAKNPQLPRISDFDTDIMQMAISGLNEAPSMLPPGRLEDEPSTGFTTTDFALCSPQA